MSEHYSIFKRPKDEPFDKLVLKSLLECNLCIYVHLLHVFAKRLKVKVTFTFDLMTSIIY